MIELLIVGGGSAGWLTATMVDALLNGKAKQKKVQITVVESEKVGRIGVGEATVPTLIQTLRDIGVPENEFLEAADATFKQGIRFEGWMTDSSRNYYHVFDRSPAGSRDMRGLNWLASDGSLPFAHYVSPQAEICDRGLAPRRRTDNDYSAPFLYAYHMDAEKFAGFLVELGKSRGIRHIVEDVVSVETENESVRKVVLEGGSRLRADWFVDCTGFARVLTKAIQNTEFVDMSEWLICDRAVAIQIPHDGVPSRLEPFTRSVALSAGWMWDIGLQTRRGTGYVHSSQHISPDDAETELRKAIPVPSELKARHLQFEVGHLASPWKGNCISIGLSGGFIEPMESTGIYLIEFAARTLCELLPLFGTSKRSAKRFNELIAARYNEVLDFVNLHYVLSDRRDTSFWRDATDSKRITPKLKDWLDLWEEKPPSPTDFANSHQLFGYQNYEYCLYGLGWRPTLLKGLQGRRMRPLASVQNAVNKLTAVLPTQQEFFFEQR